MEITVTALTFNTILKKAAEVGYKTIYISGFYLSIEEFLSEHDDKAEWLLVGNIIFNAADIGNENAEIYFLDY